MQEVFTCCVGLDVHNGSIEACVRRIEPNGRLHQETRHWGTMTKDLLAMADCMTAQGVTQVAMESTGIFWKPIFNILENRFTVLLVNARHIKQVPGRKTDIRDYPASPPHEEIFGADIAHAEGAYKGSLRSQCPGLCYSRFSADPIWPVLGDR